MPEDSKANPPSPQKGQEGEPKELLPSRQCLSIPGKVKEHLILEDISIHMDDMKMIRMVSMNSPKVNHACPT